jgi:hypothetical protein
MLELIDELQATIEEILVEFETLQTQRDALVKMLWQELAGKNIGDTIRANKFPRMTPGEFAELIQSAAGFVPEGFAEEVKE